MKLIGVAVGLILSAFVGLLSIPALLGGAAAGCGTTWATGGDVPATILAVAQAEGASERATVAAFMAAIVESGMDPTLTEADSDRDSAGLMQQRRHWLPESFAHPVGGGDWYHPDDPRLDPAWATQTFLRGINGMHGALHWDAQPSMRDATAGQLAQRVQGSAFPARYDGVRDNALAVIAAVGSPTATGSGPPPVGDPGIVNDPGYSVAAHVYEAAQVIRSIGFTETIGGADAHAWNPNSDHPKGLALDLMIPQPGTFPDPTVRAEYDALNQWLIANAEQLGVSYTIWHGLFFSPWNDWQPTRYGGGGVYDPGNATGGHYDHIHISFHEVPGSGGGLVGC